jgi:hypothetical protein
VSRDVPDNEGDSAADELSVGAESVDAPRGNQVFDEQGRWNPVVAEGVRLSDFEEPPDGVEGIWDLPEYQPWEPDKHENPSGHAEHIVADDSANSSDAQGDVGFRSAWELLPLADYPDRPAPDEIHLSDDRRVHILDGDET